MRAFVGTSQAFAQGPEYGVLWVCRKTERSINVPVLVTRLGISLDTLMGNEGDLLPSEISEL